jgi:hypothetical protein
MSGCWASDVRGFALALLLGGSLAAGGSQASVTVNGVVLGDSGRSHRSRVVVSGRGVIVGSDADVVIGTDSLGHGAIIVDDDSNGMVRFLADAHVKRGDRFDGDVVAIFGDVKIEGQVTGSAVAVFGHVDVAPGASVGSDAVAVFGSQNNGGKVDGCAVAVIGSLRLDPGSSVAGDAVAVGGRVEDSDQSHIGGESVSIGLLPLTLGLPALPAVLATIALGWLLSVFFGWLFALMFPDRLARVGVTASRQTFFSIVIALLSLLAWPAISILIMATIIGLPVGLILWFVYPILVYAGQLGATYVLGCKLLRRRLGEGPAFGPIVAGSGLIAAMFAAAAVSYSFGGAGAAIALFFGLVGLLVLLGLTTIGTGALMLSRAGSLPRDVRPGPGPAPAAQAPPMPGPATAV